MKRTALISLVVGIALTVVPIAQPLVMIEGSNGGSTQTSSNYIPGVTDFPQANAAKAHYVPGVTDFPRASYRVTPQAPAIVSTTDGGIQWGDGASVGVAAGTALVLAMLGSALLMRRRSNLAHS